MGKYTKNLYELRIPRLWKKIPMENFGNRRSFEMPKMRKEKISD